MFDQYMLVENSLANRVRDGEVVGFQVDVHYPHHCGIWLSIIEEISLNVDGNEISPDKMTLVLDGKQYSVNHLTEEEQDRWYFGQTGTLLVDCPRGLEEGSHEVTIKMSLRVSFLNWLLTGQNHKSMTIKNEEVVSI